LTETHHSQLVVAEMSDFIYFRTNDARRVLGRRGTTMHALAIHIIVTNNDDARVLLVKRVQPEWWSRLGPVLVEESVRSL
jgi:hypothetical protein